jgi:two-component system CheB/CheR fusion protein
MHPILIVDDNTLQQTLYKGLLNRLPIELTQVGTTKEAIEATRNKIFDLIIMDIMLPDGSGIDAMRRIRGDKNYTNIPIIVVSTQAIAGQEEMLRQAGATRSLAKPVDFNKVIDILNEYLKAGR